MIKYRGTGGTDKSDYLFKYTPFTYVLPSPTRKELKRSVPSVPFRGQALEVGLGGNRFMAA
ncbi:MAG: hypothetical protein HN494_02180 [Opitutae bacterium]|jgi:hypothetical protein|nr:hypothetical protein [Opitutae bacterium]MBT7742483.1 hypothetical protein [Opitutae bacterium]MBT7924457.1 hypothetical protein [Opitutae bacterium]